MTEKNYGEGIEMSDYKVFEEALKAGTASVDNKGALFNGIPGLEKIAGPDQAQRARGEAYLGDTSRAKKIIPVLEKMVLSIDQEKKADLS